MHDPVQDSFKSCTTFPAALHVLQILAPDLIARLDEDFQVSFSSHCSYADLTRPVELTGGASSDWTGYQECLQV